MSPLSNLFCSTTVTVENCSASPLHKSKCGQSTENPLALPRSMRGILLVIILQYLVMFCHCQGQRDSYTFKITELRPIGTDVGNIEIEPGFEYRFSEPQPDEFILNSFGAITTLKVLDRDESDETFNLFIQSFPSQYLIEVHIIVLDVNDNSPVFETPVIEVSFTEGSSIGTQILLDTARDRDIGVNDVTNNYHIVSGNGDNIFKLLVITTDIQEPLLYLENTKIIDREVKGSYILNISAEDGGQPPRYGFVSVSITILDVNDNQPVFAESDYFATVNETVPPGTFIIEMIATDEDINDNSLVSYSIFNDEQRQFGIDPHTGVVRTLKHLQCHRVCSTTNIGCFPNSCVVIVEASDGGKPYPQRGRAYVTVILIDENDHDPVIQFQYLNGLSHATVLENADNNIIVAVLSITDLDEGLNGQTTATITSGNEEKNFILTGLFIRVNGRLDREHVANYNLTVVAKDMGIPQRSTVGYLVVEVSDINDHEPEFGKQQYLSTLSEFDPLGSFVASVTATDSDSGINAVIQYSILSGNELGWFHLNPDTGLVTTQTLLDYEVVSSIVLVIQAQDSGTPSHQTTVELSIYITNENDETPYFVQNMLEYNIDESDGTRNDLITRVSAVDHDQGINGTITYRFAEDTEFYSYFQLDTQSGDLTLVASLDREVVDTVYLKIVASDQADEPLSSTATVTIFVTDFNDNIPVFYPTNYYPRVTESQPIHSSFLKVQATDDDKGDYGALRFAITSGNTQKFDVDEENGWILITSNNIRAGEQYTLTISATDQDTVVGNRHSSTCTVVITITNLIDQLVPFIQEIYRFSILEDNSRLSSGRTSRIVGSVGVELSQSGFAYSIINGDPNGTFSISSSGSISTAKTVDREEVSKYNLTVAAIKDTWYGEVHVLITVDDINDYRPSFGHTFVEAFVDEDAPIGHGIYLANAEDKDSDDNAVLAYQITSGASNYLALDESTGLIYVAQSLLNKASVIRFRMLVTDGTLSSELDIIIHIEDVNNHIPMFEHLTYEISVSESASVNTQFFSIKATDEDKHENGELQYRIINGNVNSDFAIFPNGFLYIAQSLDRESQDACVLNVVVNDHGLVPQSSEATVIIHILDSNDNKPQFTNSSYNMYLIENAEMDSFVGIVHATDPDVGRNAEVTYHMDTSSDFYIDPFSGILRSCGIFDRELLIDATGHDYVSAYVIATDNGDIKQTARTLVLIHLVDNNDNAPTFERDVYEQSIFENAEMDTSITTLTAVDADSGVNADITYTIIEGNEENNFMVDPITGQINKIGAIDREQLEMYTLTVMAMDGGEVPLNHTSLVVITVLDVNDNAPEFIQVTNVIELEETTQLGVFLFEFIAVDKDVGNNAQVSYHLTSGNVGGKFHIDTNTGRLYLNFAVDYEHWQQYTLSVTAQDMGTPSQTTTTMCRIDVIDANDNAPVFDPDPIVVEVFEDILSNSNVVAVSARDDDSGVNAEIHYSINSQDPQFVSFAIHPTSGMIRTTAPLNYEVTQEYHVTVVATDQAEYIEHRKQASTVVQIRVKDVNDNAPIFESMSAIAVPARSSSNIITTVRASDADTGENGVVDYSILDSTFYIDDIGRLTSRTQLQTGNHISTQYFVCHR